MPCLRQALLLLLRAAMTTIGRAANHNRSLLPRAQVGPSKPGGRAISRARPDARPSAPPPAGPAPSSASVAPPNKEGVRLPDAPPLVLTRDLVDAFSDPSALTYDWIPEVTGDVLNVSIRSGISEVCSFSLTKSETAIAWNDITRFTCLSSPEEGVVNIQGITEDRETLEINFTSSCLELANCDRPRVCTINQTGRELKDFLDHQYRYYSDCVV